MEIQLTLDVFSLLLVTILIITIAVYIILYVIGYYRLLEQFQEQIKEDEEVIKSVVMDSTNFAYDLECLIKYINCEDGITRSIVGEDLSPKVKKAINYKKIHNDQEEKVEEHYYG